MRTARPPRALDRRQGTQARRGTAGKRLPSLDRRVAERARRLQMVADLSERLNAILNPQVLLAELTQQLTMVFGYYFVSVFVLNEPAAQLELQEAAGQSAEALKTQKLAIPLYTPQSLVAKAARTAKVVVVDDVRQTPDWLFHPCLPNTRSEIAVPILVQGRVIGVLDVEEDAPAAFDTGEVDLFRSLAGQIGIAWHNARLYAELEQRVAERTAALVATEEALRSSVTLFHSLIESLPHNIYSKDLEGRFVFANQRYCQTEGKPLAAILGRTDFELHPPELAAKYRADDQRVLETNRLFETVEEHTPLGGETTYVQVIKTPVYDAEGRTIGVLGIFWDITERKRSELQIARLKQLLQSITDSMPSALIALDPGGRVLIWNPVAAKLTGCTAEQVQGQVVWEVCPELARYRPLFEQVLQARQVVHFSNEEVVTEQGRAYWELSAFPLLEVEEEAADVVSGVVLRLDDVTRRVQLEEMMVQAAKLASVGGLAAGVAHEINNPLAVMMQGAQLVQRALDVERPQTRERLLAGGVPPLALADYLQSRSVMEYLDGIREAGARAARIVNDLLSFARQHSAVTEPCDLNDLIRQALALAAADYDLRQKQDFRQLEVRYELNPELPPLVCDGPQIQQVVLNLVRNAIQAMAEKRGRLEAYHPCLTVRTDRRGDGIRLEVEDNGPGLPASIQARLFEPFATTKPVGEGTGLGLWLCWSIVVEQHGGRIWAEPGPEGGTRMVVELPGQAQREPEKFKGGKELTAHEW